MKNIGKLLFITSLFLLVSCSHKPETVTMTRAQYDLLETAHRNLYEAFLKQRDAMNSQEYYFKSKISKNGRDSIYKAWMEQNQESADSFFENDFYYRNEYAKTRIHPKE